MTNTADEALNALACALSHNVNIAAAETKDVTDLCQYAADTITAVRQERDGLRERLAVYEGDHSGPVSFTGMVEDMAGALTEPTYTQADLDAAVAAALEDAARSACEWWADDDPRELSAHLRRLYPDARATLAARDRSMIAEGMRRAAEICEVIRHRQTIGPMPERACFDQEQTIRAEAEKISPARRGQEDGRGEG